jgi:dual specificity phosphatase 12
MFKLPYDFFYMSRMLKDKMWCKLYEYVYSEDYQNVERMEDVNVGVLKTLYNLTYQPTHIIDTIYLGNAYNASNYSSLVENNIGLIVNITCEIPNYYSYIPDFTYHNIYIKDANDNHIKSHIENVLNVIKTYRETRPDKNILIHCYMGSSRSASFVVAYLVKNHFYDVDDAISFIKDKRSLVNINTTFIRDLREWSLE